MKLLQLLVLCFGLVGGLMAQHNKPHYCGYDHVIMHLEQQYPGYKQYLDAAFLDANRSGSASQYQRTVHVVPVAFHVVWKTEEHKVTECKVREQIEVLNEDFRRQNADANNLRPIFDSIAADTEIEFRLDTIIWTQSDIDFHTLGPFGGLFPDITSIDSVKGTSKPLNPSQYLNIWSVNLGSGGLLGYAYPPDSLPNWPAGSSAPSPNKQGVVLHYSIIGREGGVTVSSPLGGSTSIVTQGRTATHEVGHYMGLRHIWGDGTGSFIPQPSCSVDDGITDTPNCLDKSDFDCDTTKNTCEQNAPNDMPDMVENFMDYAAESCMNTFTIGQKNHMKGVLNLQRAGFMTTPVITRPVNDAFMYADVVNVNTTSPCAAVYNGTTAYASPTLTDSTCMGTVLANDVWMSFTATAATMTMQATTGQLVYGADDNMAFELYKGICDSMEMIDCGALDTIDLQGLTVSDMYYIRVYNLDNTSGQNFELCISDASLIPTRKLQDALAAQVKVYPNPSTGLITVDLEGVPTFEGTIQVRNAIGQAVTNQLLIDHQAEKVELNLATLPNGLYLIEMDIQGAIVAKKVLLQR